jgi:type I restriction enzyme S subunit
MIEWKYLNEICGIYDGTHQTPIYTDYGVKFVSVENISAPYSSNKYISEEDYSKNYKTKPQKGDVLMTRIGDVGTCAVLDSDEPIAYYVSLALLRPNVQLVQSNYVKYILESNIGKRELRKKTLLTAVPLKINLGDVGKIKLPIPSLSEQDRVVGILNTFTSSINNLKQQISQRHKQYDYYRDLLIDNESADGVEEKTLGSMLLSLKTGLNPRKNFILNDEGSSNYYITVRELGVFDIIPCDKTDKVTDDALKLINNRSNLEVGDVLFSGTGTIGRTALIKEKPQNWNIKEGVYALKPKKEILNSRYLIHLLHANSTIDKISSLIVGDPIKSIPMKSLVTIPVLIPPLREQQRIVDILDKFEVSIQNLEAQLSQREKQYEYYRNKLLTFD